MRISRFSLVCLLGLVLGAGGCFDDDTAKDKTPDDRATPDDPENPDDRATPVDPAKPNDPDEPNTPAARPPGDGPLQGTLYWTSDGNNEIHKLDLATGTDTILGAGRGADVAPDGKLVFVGQPDLVEAAPEALEAQTTIVEHDFDAAESANDNFKDPKVSPDGTKVVYSNLARNTYVVDRVDGTILARFEATGAQRYDRATWTPDGRLVMAGGFGNPGLYVSDTALTDLTRFDPDLELNVAYPAEPAVSPDGTTVAFMVENQIQTLKLDGTDLATLTDEDEAKRPTWSPDGAYIAYASGSRIKIRPAAGGDAVDLLDTYPALKTALVTGFGGLSNQFSWGP